MLKWENNGSDDISYRKTGQLANVLWENSHRLPQVRECRPRLRQSLADNLDEDGRRRSESFPNPRLPSPRPPLPVTPSSRPQSVKRGRHAPLIWQVPDVIPSGTRTVEVDIDPPLGSNVPDDYFAHW
jgi:hypothetical protein